MLTTFPPFDTIPFASDYLRTSPSDHVIDTAATYFPGLDVVLLQQWWAYVDDGCSVSSGMS